MRPSRRRVCRRLSRAIEALEPRMLLSASLLKDINPGTGVIGTPSWITDVNGVVFFNSRQKLWRSDGSDAGTFQLNRDPDNVWDPTQLINVSGTLFFASFGQLWKTDGTTPGTVEVSA